VIGREGEVLLRRVGSCRAIDTLHVGKKEWSMQRHIHMHKNLHGAMYNMWRKWVIAQEKGAEPNAIG
jgi:hypothetical protein